MLTPLASALVATLGLPQVPHDPRSAPTRVRHALFELAEVRGRVESLGDLDGDGLEELVGALAGQLVCFQGGTGVRRGDLSSRAHLVAVTNASTDGPRWAVGPDLNGDGAREVALLVRTSDGLELRIVSGRDGAPTFVEATGDGPFQALTWFGDADGDGVRDLATIAAHEGALVARSGATGERLWAAPTPIQGRFGARLQDVGDRDGDGVADLLLDDGPLENSHAQWLSGRTGESFSDPAGRVGPFTALGDLDGDGLGDLAIGGAYGGFASGPELEVRCTTGAHPWRAAKFPDQWPVEWPDGPVVRAVGDLDGDGCPEVALGDTNFHLRDAREAAGQELPAKLDGVPLQNAVLLRSKPMSVSHESGQVRVHSGATGRVLLAIFGEPGTHWGLGGEVWPVADQSGDGIPDLAVNTANGMSIFATAATPPSSDPFEWLPGRWVSEREVGGVVRVSEEHWLAPAAGRMLGVNQAFTRGAKEGGSFEFLRLERKGADLDYVAQPGGAAPTRFTASELGPWTALFTNPTHDFPTQIRYTRDGDTLRAEVGTEAEPARLRFEWRRAEEHGPTSHGHGSGPR